MKTETTLLERLESIKQEAKSDGNRAHYHVIDEAIKEITKLKATPSNLLLDKVYLVPKDFITEEQKEFILDYWDGRSPMNLIDEEPFLLAIKEIIK
jgi:hypothetical protein